MMRPDRLEFLHAIILSARAKAMAIEAFSRASVPGLSAREVDELRAAAFIGLRAELEEVGQELRAMISAAKAEARS